MEVDEETLQFFRKRGDKQIMSLELLAIAIGVCGSVLVSMGHGSVLSRADRGVHL